MQKLHVKYNTIHMSRQQDKMLILLEISAIFGFVQCFCGLRRICFGAFSGTGSWAAQRSHGTGAAIDGSLSAGVYWNRIRNMKCCSLRGRHPDKFRKFGAKSVVITSAKIKNSDCKCVFGYDDKTKEYFKIDFEEIHARFPGTGDIFSAVFMGKILDGCSLYDATERAMTSVRNMIKRNMQILDKYKGIPIETCLEEID